MKIGNMILSLKYNLELMMIYDSLIELLISEFEAKRPLDRDYFNLIHCDWYENPLRKYIVEFSSQDHLIFKQFVQRGFIKTHRDADNRKIYDLR